MNHKLFFFACALNLFYYVPNLLASPVIGGKEDTRNYYKYHVSIQRNYDPTNADSSKHICGGAIIDNSYVLTAAHCFIVKDKKNVVSKRQPKSSNMVVVAGTIKTYGSGIVVSIEEVLIPREFYNDGADKYADIAVIKLAASLNVAHHTQILEIAKLDPGHAFRTYEHQDAIVLGNGCDTLHKGDDGALQAHPTKDAEKRQFLKVYMVEEAKCPTFDHSICALTFDRKNIRACARGDGGSPLVYKDTVIGVLNHGTIRFIGDIQTMTFSRVTPFMKFITDAMNESIDHSQMDVLDD